MLRVLLFCLLSISACRLSLKPNAGALVTCESNATCPEGWSCEGGQCFEPNGARPPRLLLRVPERAVGTLTFAVTAIDTEDKRVSLSVRDGSDQTLLVSPSEIDASVSGVASQVTISGLPGTGAAPALVTLTLVADNQSFTSSYTLSFLNGDEAPVPKSLTVTAPGGIASAIADVDLLLSDAAGDAVFVQSIAYRRVSSPDALVPIATNALIGANMPLATSASGVQHRFQLDTRALPDKETLSLVLTLVDALGSTSVAESDVFLVDNGPSVRLLPGAAESPRPIVAATLTVAVADPSFSTPEGDVVSLSLEASTDYSVRGSGGGTWFAVTTGSTGITQGGDVALTWALAQDAPLLQILGESSVFDPNDVLTVPRQRVVSLRVTAEDLAGHRVVGPPVGPLLIGDDAPVLSIAGDTSEQRGLVPIQLTFSDTGADPIDLELQFRINSGDVWRKLQVAFGITEQLSTGSLPRSQVIVWQSTAPLSAAPDVAQGIGNQRLPTVQVRARALTTLGNRRHASDWTAPTQLSVNNQTPPQLRALYVPNNGEFRHGVQPIVYALTDAESDRVDLRLEYSLDSGASWRPCSEAPSFRSEGRLGLASSPDGLEHTFMWDSYADVAVDANAVRVRGIATDASMQQGEEVEVLLLTDARYVQAPGAFAGGYVTNSLTAPTGNFRTFELADLNHDGSTDVVLLATTDSSDFVLQPMFATRTNGVPDGGFAPGTPTVFTGGSAQMSVGDVNGDALIDVLTADGSLFFGQGAGTGFTFAAPVVTSCDGSECPSLLRDMDGDGLSDLVRTALNRVVYWKSSGPAWLQGPAVSLTPSGAPTRVPTLNDVDLDGVPDLVFQFGGTLEIRRGEVVLGDYAMAATGTSVDMPYFQDIQDLAAADFDADGDADILFAPGTPTDFRILFAGPSGYLWGPGIAPSAFANDVVVADINQDGALDFVSNSLTEPQIQIHFGDLRDGRPVGSFSRVFRPGFSAYDSLRISDVNADGVLDIVDKSGFFNASVRLYVSQSSHAIGSSTFSPPVETAAPSFIQLFVRARDANADGVWDDFVGVRSDAVAVGLAHRVGLVHDRTAFPVAPSGSNGFIGSLIAADLNLDGVDDVITLGQETGTAFSQVHISYGQGQPFAGDGTLMTGANFTAGLVDVPTLGLGDLDGDGRQDMVASRLISPSASGGLIQIFLNGATGFTSGVVVDTGAESKATAIVDFNGDGHADVVSFSPDTMSAFFGHGARATSDWTLDAPVSVPVPVQANYVAVADLDTDGYADIVGVNDNAGCETFVVWGGTAWPPVVTVHATLPSLRVAAVDIVDVDLDGVADVVVAGGLVPESPQLHILLTPAWRGVGSRSPAIVESMPTGASVRDFDWTDLNYDGVPDMRGSGISSRRMLSKFGRAVAGWRGRSLAVVEGPTGSVSGYQGAAWLARAGSSLSTQSRVGIRLSWGARDDYFGTLAGLGGHGDFAHLLRQAGAFASGVHVPLSSPWSFDGDVALRRVPDVTGSRFVLSPRFGHTAPGGSTTSDDANRVGLTLASRTGERGLVLELPFIGTRSASASVRVYAVVRRFRTAASYPSDPLSSAPEALTLLPRLPLPDGSYRDVVRPEEVLVSVPQNDSTDLAAGTVVGKRFVVDHARRVVRVLTDELGRYQAFTQ